MNLCAQQRVTHTFAIMQLQQMYQVWGIVAELKQGSCKISRAL